jgi:hypothetical protein
MPVCVGDQHESLLQGYQILQEVKRMLRGRVPGEFVLEFIYACEASRGEGEGPF